MPDPPKPKAKPAWKNPYVIGAIVIGGLVLAYYLYRHRQASAAQAAVNTGTSAPLDSSGGISPGAGDSGSGGGLSGTPDQSTSGQSDLLDLIAAQQAYDQQTTASNGALLYELGGVQSSLSSTEAQLAALLASGSHPGTSTQPSGGSSAATSATHSIEPNTVYSALSSPSGFASQATPAVQAARPGGLSVSTAKIKGTNRPQGVISIH